MTDQPTTPTDTPTRSKADTDLLTLAEAQKLLRVSHWTLHRLIAERQLPTVSIGRRRFLTRGDVAAFIAKARNGGRP